MCAKSNPTRTGGCGWEDCLICLDEKQRGRCERRHALYKVTCEDCRRDNIGAVYGGDCGGNGYSRWKSHLEAICTNDKTNALKKHMEVQHGGQISDLKMEVVSTFRSTLERQS